MNDLNSRAKEILRLVVDAYVETGGPVGSKAVSQKLGLSLSSATIRSVMSELEDQGLLYAPHTSAGRLPTDAGMTVFVEGLLEFGDLPESDRHNIEHQIREQSGQPVTSLLEHVSAVISGLSSCASLVIVPKAQTVLKQVEFVRLGANRILTVLVSENGSIENRILETTEDLPPATLTAAANYLNARIAGRTLAEIEKSIRREQEQNRHELDKITARLVEQGLACMAPKEAGGHIIVRGQSRLLDDITALDDLERIRVLFRDLESKDMMVKLLKAAETAEGVQIFIGAENKLFGYSGCSMILSPYHNPGSKIVGAVGVIGPTRLNYGRIIPIINYTSRLMGRLLESESLNK